MSIARYGVIKGTPTQYQLGGRAAQPHLHIELTANGSLEDIAVNVLSMDGSEVLYEVRDGFTPANAAALKALSIGATQCHGNDGIAIDYIRTPGLVDKSQMKQLDPNELHMHDAVIAMLDKAIAQKATVYVFGQQFRNGGGKNPFFGFTPDQGGHDCHMNQGNPRGNHDQDNGTYQDGGVFVEWSDGSWSALFIAFQSQSWTTDNNGNAV